MVRRLQFLFIVLIILMSGCQKTEESNEPGFVDQYAFVEKGDGWIYDVIIETSKLNGKRTFLFDGVNLKHKEIEGFYVPILDENSNEIDRGNPTIPSVANNSSMKEEVKKINAYFDEEQFVSPITEEDIIGLETKYFTHEDIINLVNNALKDPFAEKGFGEYNIAQVNCEQMKLKDGSIIQVSYSSIYGYIRVVNLEYIYPDGTYLLDVIASNNGNEMQMKVAEDLTRLEKEIVENQEVGNREIQSPIGDKEMFNERLYFLLNGVFKKQ